MVGMIPSRSGPVPGRARWAARAQFLGFPKTGPRADEDLLAGGGDVHLSAVPVEDAHPERLFELPDLGAQRRLGDVAGFGCPAEVPGFGDGDGVFELS